MASSTDHDGQADTPAAMQHTGLTDDTMNGLIAQGVAALREEVAGGFLYSHRRANANTSRMLEVASFLYALVELLKEKGLITIDELDARKDAVAERVNQRFLSKGMGVVMQDPERDKYQVEHGIKIDCASRVHLCKAACCRLWFPLSKQDVQEGIVQWDLSHPYVIAQDADGYCTHNDRTGCHCTIYQHRPLPCRTFDCRQDERIWLDFDNKVINPELDAIFTGKQAADGGTTP